MGSFGSDPRVPERVIERWARVIAPNEGDPPPAHRNGNGGAHDRGRHVSAQERGEGGHRSRHARWRHLRRELDGLRGQVGQLAGQLAGLQGEVEQLRTQAAGRAGAAAGPERRPDASEAVTDRAQAQFHSAEERVGAARATGARGAGGGPDEAAPAGGSLQAGQRSAMAFPTVYHYQLEPGEAPPDLDRLTVPYVAARMAAGRSNRRLRG